MIIKIDSRETLPLYFPKHFTLISETKIEKLDVGDYGCIYKDGYIPPFYVERKSIGDLFGTLTSGYDRFKAEIERAIESNVIMTIAIEESLTDVRRGHTYPKRNDKGEMIECHIPGEPRVKQLMTLWAKYGIDAHFFTSRSEMSYWIYTRFVAIGELYIKDKLGFKTASIKKIKEML